MKTVGGVRRQITQLYLAGVAIYGLLALLIAVPLGAFLGYALSTYILGIINVPVSTFDLVASSLLVQIAAGLMVPLLAIVRARPPVSGFPDSPSSAPLTEYRGFRFKHANDGRKTAGAFAS